MSENPYVYPGKRFQKDGWIEDQNAPKEYYPGMTLRDYFAGRALAGIWGSGTSRTLNAIKKTAASTNSSHERVLAVMAYATADAMLKEREKIGD